MKIALLSFLISFTNAFAAEPGMEFHGHWRGTGVFHWGNQFEDCDFDIHVYRICDGAGCQPKIYIEQEQGRICTPREALRPPHPLDRGIWAYVHIENNALIDVNWNHEVGFYSPNYFQFRDPEIGSRETFWLHLNPNNTVSFHADFVGYTSSWDAVLSKME